MQLWRYHGLGNDYLVMEGPQAPSPAMVRALCDRHRGVGSDGILWGTLEPPYRLRIFNPDGSEAEKSGNGLRIFIRHLQERHGALDRLQVATLGGVVSARKLGAEIEVDMGEARCEALEELVTQLQEPSLQAAWRVNIGNPHCVLWTTQRDLDALSWRRWGEQLEHHPLFPERSNIQLARVSAADELEARIWERGAGETAASGSSACAVAASAWASGRLQRGPVRVVMPGGVLALSPQGERGVRMRGPVECVGSFTVDPRWLEARSR